MPSLFVSHGAPTYALDPGLAGRQLGQLGQQLERPRAIVIVSPHWMTQGVWIGASSRPKTIHDFGGFPRALYCLQYQAPGAPQVASRIRQLLLAHSIPAQLDEDRGLDHGAWVPLLHLYPQADIPTLQVSMPFDSTEQTLYDFGRALAPLANEGVLLMGSGSLTHNLSEVRMAEPNGRVEAYAEAFSFWVRQAVIDGDTNRLLQTFKKAPHARRAHPTTEHFLPLLFAAGAAQGSYQAKVLDGGIRYGVLSMESYLFGRV